MTLQLVVDNTAQNEVPKVRMDEAKEVEEFSIVRFGGFVGKLVKESEEFPHIADNHGSRLELFPNDELEILLTPNELAEFWLKNEKPTPDYPVALREYDDNCRWKCGEICEHTFNWVCPTCRKETSAAAAEFGKYHSRNGDCLDCQIAEAEKEINLTNAGEEDENSCGIFDYYSNTSGN